jgi:hypothetical protein
MTYFPISCHGVSGKSEKKGGKVGKWSNHVILSLFKYNDLDLAKSKN